jgi:hypothetical protein
MTEGLLIAIIAASATVLGAVIGGIFVNPRILDGLFSRRKFENLLGEWDSSWSDESDPDKMHREIVQITKQRNDRIWGVATRDSEPDKKWELEGFYQGQFLLILYSPSHEAKNKTFLDYGCYFLQRKGNGQFKGFSTGYGSDELNPDAEDKISTDPHVLRRRE